MNKGKFRRKLTDLPFILVLFLLTLVYCTPLFAQNGANWLQAIIDNQLEISSLKGGTQFQPYPILQATFNNRLAEGYDVFAVGGDILKPATPGYCTVILAGSNEPLRIEPSGTPTTHELVVYCIELPIEGEPNGKKPDESADYLQLNYGGLVNDEIKAVLQRAREGNFIRNFGTQLAVWSVYHQLSLDQLSQQLGQPFVEFQPVVDYLLGKGPLPIVTPPPTTNPAIATAVPNILPTQTSGNSEQTEDSAPQTSPIIWLWAALLGAALFAIFGLVLVLNKRRANNPVAAPVGKRVPVASAESAPKIPAPPSAENRPATAAAQSNKAAPKCLICGEEHETRDCYHIQRPNRVFVPTEAELTLANVDPSAPTPEPAEPPPPPIIAPSRSRAKSVREDTYFIEPTKGKSMRSSQLDDEYYEAAKLRVQFAQELEDKQLPTDTSPVAEDESTGPTSRKHVTYVIREKESSDILGTLGDDGGVISRTSLKNQQILLPTKDISTPHALLRLRPDGRVTLKDLRSRNGTFVDNEQISDGKQVVLQDGAQIRFGDSAEFELDLSQRRLISLNDDTTNRDLSSSEQWLVTRRMLHTVLIRHSQISTPHLLIRPSGDSVSDISVKDLHSHNPTYIDQTDLASYSNGTYIQSGSLEFRVGKQQYVIQSRTQNTPDKIGDHYKVLQQIYISKMADIYRVQDGRRNGAPHQVAKMLNVHQEKIDLARQAFDAEIKLMQQIKHPNVLPCTDVGYDTNYNAPYFIMPWLDGSDMRQIMLGQRRSEAEHGLKLTDVRQLFIEICSAVDAIHRQGYAHCDIKPANIFITPQGHLYLIDLGVATPLGKNAEFFTQYYSAPEAGDKQFSMITPSTDVYSLGVVLFELITGVEPKELYSSTSATSNDGDTDHVRPVLNARENLQKWLQKTTYGIEFLDVIHTATQYLPNNRYQTVSEFEKALLAVCQQPKIAKLLTQEGASQLSALLNSVGTD